MHSCVFFFKNDDEEDVLCLVHISWIVDMSEEIVTCLEGVAPRTRLLMQELTQADRVSLES
jgi:hypothetical protein